jgi:quinoprotein glucose dehydrogenase
MPTVIVLLLIPVLLISAEWPYYGGDPGGTRYSPLSQINRSNVARLKRAWVYHTGEVMPGTMSTDSNRVRAFETTPLMVDNILYFTTATSRLIALDAETGKELWKYDPQAGAARRRALANRGAAYWEGRSASGKSAGRRIMYATVDAKLIQLDARTGKPSPGFGREGVIDLREGVADKWPRSNYAVTSPPAIYRDLVITGSTVPEGPGKGPSGMIRAFNVRDGGKVWEFRTVPLPGQPGNETWEDGSWQDRTGVNVWSIMSVDSARGLIFLPVGSAAYDFYGGDRKGKNLYANSLVALDAATGKVRWHFQTVHHDIWDYDLPAQPTLVTLWRDGREIPAVVQVTKMGFVFVFDRRTGEPVFPIEERKVPRSDVPGEATWPTQPFPVKPPPVSRQSITRDELSNVTPESQKYCRELFGGSVTQGMFTPWGLKQTLVMPGTLGGATWSGGAFDPRTSYYFVNTNEQGAIGLMELRPSGSPMPYQRNSKWGAYARFQDSNGWPCVKPPWGTLNAINLKTGELAWRVPLGIVDELADKGLPATGAPNLGGAIVTGGGLVFIAGTNDGRFRAFDASSGKELWVTRLTASGHATPMTYTGARNQRQYVVIAAGGGGFFAQPAADVLEAYVLD